MRQSQNSGETAMRKKDKVDYEEWKLFSCNWANFRATQMKTAFRCLRKQFFVGIELINWK